jgi:glycine cleavage system H protein
MSAPANARFARSHEWITAGSPHATVGISDHAQKELGDVVYLELPKPGRKVKAGESIAVIESVKAASDIYAPVSGEITEVNAAAAADASLVNSDPYGAGWLFRIAPDNTAEIEALLPEADYLASLS